MTKEDLPSDDSIEDESELKEADFQEEIFLDTEWGRSLSSVRLDTFRLKYFILSSSSTQVICQVGTQKKQCNVYTHGHSLSKQLCTSDKE